jgi:hypothetical protein
MQWEERLPIFRMMRVELPGWARRPDAHLDNMRLSDYHAIQQRRGQMLDVVHREVEAYLNTPGLYGEGGDGMFPDRSRMSGEYYVSDESYTGHVGPVWIQVGVICHCLEEPARPGQENRDYLGLEVWLRCDPNDWSFAVFRNTDSSAI